jgi:hypothetical protein
MVVQVQSKGVILSIDWTPKVEDFGHRILFESAKRYSLFDNQSLVLMEFLTVVRGSKKLGHFWSSPDDCHFFFSLHFSFLFDVNIDLAQLLHHVLYLFSIKRVS